MCYLHPHLQIKEKGKLRGGGGGGGGGGDSPGEVVTLQGSGMIPDQERRAETSFQEDVRVSQSVFISGSIPCPFPISLENSTNPSDHIWRYITPRLVHLVTPVPPSVPSSPSIIDITSTSIFTVGGQYSYLRRTSVTPCSLVHTHLTTHQLLTVQHHAITIGMVSIAQ